MKTRVPGRITAAICLVLGLLTEADAAESINSVLFIGNSLTERNNLPEVFRQFAAGSPLHQLVSVRSLTPGGAFLADHWKSGQAVALMRQLHPEVVVLQGQSTEPLSAPRSFSYYGALFKDEADRLRIKMVLFGTWARPAGDGYYNDPTSGWSPAEMQARLNRGYANLARQLGVPLAPVGVAWDRAHHDLPSVELLDGTQHPAPAGTYLAAAVLFRTVFNQSAATSNYYFSLPIETALALQRVASAISLDHEL